MRSDDRRSAHLGRRALLGAVVGALVGAVLGWAIHRLVRDGGSAAWYELTGALLGAIAGVALGAFYGGALSLRGHPDHHP